MIPVYAVLAVLGAVLPWIFNLQLAAAGGMSFSGFLGGVFANPASSSIGVDILVGATAFNVWMVREARRLGMKHVWVYIAVTFLVAFACACPLFLLMRERRLREMKANGA
jgi:hypothetical protein